MLINVYKINIRIQYTSELTVEWSIVVNSILTSLKISVFVLLKLKLSWQWTLLLITENTQLRTVLCKQTLETAEKASIFTSIQVP